MQIPSEIATHYVGEDDYGALEIVCKPYLKNIISIYNINNNLEIDTLYSLRIALEAIHFNQIFLKNCTHIKFALIQSSDHICSASKIKDKYFIIISDSLFRCLDVIARIIAESPNFRFILHDEYDGYLTTDEACSPNGLPLDLAVASQTTILYCFIFNIVGHELCHIIHGHLSVQEMARGAERKEYKWIESDDRYLTSRVLEYDADCFSATFFMRLMQSGIVFPEFILFEDLKARIFRINYFCIIFLWGAIKGHGTDVLSGEKETHPKTITRNIIIEQVMIKFLASIDEVEAKFIDQKNDVFFNISAECIRRYYGAGVFEKLSNSYRSFKDSEMQFEVSKLNGRWARLYPILSERKLVKYELAAPTQVPA